MSNKSIRNKEAILRHVRRARDEGRPVVGGFAFAFAAGVCAAHRANEAEVLVVAMKAEAPPAHCPACGQPCSFAVRDPNGDWTWCCAGGCNP